MSALPVIIPVVIPTIRTRKAPMTHLEKIQSARKSRTPFSVLLKNGVVYRGGRGRPPSGLDAPKALWIAGQRGRKPAWA